MKQCLRCSSVNIRRSHTRNLSERILKLFFRKYYRCIDCDWRGIIKTKASFTRCYAKEYIFLQIIAVIIIIIIIYLIISFLCK